MEMLLRMRRNLTFAVNFVGGTDKRYPPTMTRSDNGGSVFTIMKMQFVVIAHARAWNVDPKSVQIQALPPVPPIPINQRSENDSDVTNPNPPRGQWTLTCRVPQTVHTTRLHMFVAVVGPPKHLIRASRYGDDGGGERNGLIWIIYGSIIILCSGRGVARGR
jgi:hypothetical protein